MRRLFCVAGLVLFSTLAVSAYAAGAQDRAALELVHKAVAAHGGADAMRRVEESGITTGKIISYSPARSEASFKAHRTGDSFRLDIEAPSMKVTLAATADGGWMEFAGQISDLPESARKQIEQSKAHSALALLEVDGKDVRLSSLDECALPDGREVPGVEIRSAEGAVTRFYFDEETNLVAKIEYEGQSPSAGGTSTYELYPSDYREIDGALVPFVTDRYIDGEKAETTIVDTCDLTAEIAASVFDKPQTQALEPRSFEPVAVPIEFISKERYGRMRPDELEGKFVIANEIVAKVSINGNEPVTCLVDTGAGLTVIDDDYAGAIGLEIAEGFQAKSAGGAVEVDVAKVDSIKMGDAEVKDAQVLIIDLSMIGDADTARLDAVVGYNFLNRFMTQIDYQGQTITFSDPQKATDLQPGQVAIPMDVQGGMPAIEALLNGTEEITMRVDTGATRTHIPPATAAALKPEHTVPGGISWGVGKQFVQHKAMLLDSFAVGGLGVEDVLVSFPSGEIPASDRAESETQATGLLGNDILSLFKVGLDYERRRLILEPVPGARPSLDAFCAVGLDLTPTAAGLEVTGVVERSSAEQEGLRAGDLVLSVNGLKISEDNPFEMHRQFRGPAGTRIRLEVRRGEDTFDAEVEKRMLLQPGLSLVESWDRDPAMGATDGDVGRILSP